MGDSYTLKRNLTFTMTIFGCMLLIGSVMLLTAYGAGAEVKFSLFEILSMIYIWITTITIASDSW
jgi:hypothetical protein